MAECLERKITRRLVLCYNIHDSNLFYFILKRLPIKIALVSRQGYQYVVKVLKKRIIRVVLKQWLRTFLFSTLSRRNIY